MDATPLGLSGHWRGNARPIPRVVPTLGLISQALWAWWIENAKGVL